MIELFPHSPKLLHSYIRKKKKGRLSIGPLKLPNGQTVDEPTTMSNILVDAFASVFVGTTPIVPAPGPVQLENMEIVEFSLGDVESVLKGLDVSTAAGPDNMHPALLKSCALELSYPLFIIFQKSLQHSVLPSLWKTSLVAPIFKSGSRYSPLNYRPVSLTSVCCKAMERILVEQLKEHLEDNGLLSTHQFGFRKARSTEDQLLLTYKEVTDWTNEGYVVDMALLDLSKAFDLVNHSVLLIKLRNLGVCGLLISWVEAFLRNRVMRVLVDGCCSEERDVLSGVPQGSVLGPVLFLVYVNDLTRGALCSFKAFADDYKLYVRHKQDKALATTGTLELQHDLDLVSSTAQSWNLRLNPEKCVVMRFSRYRRDLIKGPSLSPYHIGGVQMKFVMTHRDLGVIIDSSLKFHNHVGNTVRSASGLANNLLRSTVCHSASFMVSLWVTHIRPVLDYCSTVWNTGYLGDLRLLESVQRRWTKQIEGCEELDYGARLRELSLFSVKVRLLRSDLIKYWKIIRGHGVLEDSGIFTLSEVVHTRGHLYKLRAPEANTDIHKRIFSARCVRLWNRLPSEVVEADSVDTYKRLLVLHLGDVLYEFV